MRHNDALTVLGACPCPCHPLRGGPLADRACWCTPRRAPANAQLTAEERAALRLQLRRTPTLVDRPHLLHSDAVSVLSTCPCPCHTNSGACVCRDRTDPAIAAAVRSTQDRKLHHRLATGRASIAEYAKHAPWVLTRR